MPTNFVPLAKCYAPPKASLWRRLLYFLARRSYGMLLQKNYRVQHLGADFLRQLRAPYVLLANHVTNDDPFIYNILCPYPIAWIIGKSIERDSKFPWLLRILRCISRSKEMSDLDTIKKIRQWIEAGEVVGIFPEGQTSFSGVSHPLPEATAKLLRFLKVPVVALRNEGGYFVRPRWAKRRRCSRKSQGAGTTLHYELLFDSAQIKSARLTEISTKIRQALNHNPYRQFRDTEKLHKTTPLLDRGLRRQNLAEHMELLFYTCLSCGKGQNDSSLGAMQSRGMNLRCLACGALWRISDDSHFLQHGAQHYDLEQYYQGQLQLLQKLAAAYKLQIKKKFARLRCYRTTARTRSEAIYKNGLIELSARGLTLSLTRRQNESLYHFPVEKIFASHVFCYNTWEFHATDETGKSRLFVLEFPRQTDSAFLLLDSLKALQKQRME